MPWKEIDFLPQLWFWSQNVNMSFIDTSQNSVLCKIYLGTLYLYVYFFMCIFVDNFFPDSLQMIALAEDLRAGFSW